VTKKFDFSGYATKYDVQCSDGRIIHKDAFKDNHGQTVPLVWQHLHNNPTNILGHAFLEHRDDSVYAFCLFNESEQGKQAKLLVEHGDITALSIYANKLKQKGNEVLHGAIREVSLVLSGANPGALIDNLAIEHGDGSTTPDETEAIIYSGLNISLTDIEHSEKSEEKEDTRTVKDIFDSFTEEQKNIVYSLISHAISHSDMDEPEEEVKHAVNIALAKINAQNKGGGDMKKNVFDMTGEDKTSPKLTHAQMKEIFADAQKCGSFKEAFLQHVVTYGIENIDYLFPDARTITSSPEFLSRRMEWVAGVISGTKHSPFSRIKTVYADITGDDARAKGYVKGALKDEEFFALYKRSTTPTTIYKKQKLDRDDIIDITDLDVVAWLKAEMRMMLDEEIARAVLIGDGRNIMHADKIDETAIRPIYTDSDVYAVHTTIASDHDTEEIIEDIIRARKEYKGVGNPTFYVNSDTLTDMLLLKDNVGRRLYLTVADLAAVLRVSSIVEVPVMDSLTRLDPNDAQVTWGLIGIIVNLNDYTLGADKGGAVSMFDDFDIDYNQYKYLIETRCSGALTKLSSALVIEQIQT
jgi:hypothetical protein